MLSVLRNVHRRIFSVSKYRIIYCLNKTRISFLFSKTNNEGRFAMCPRVFALSAISITTDYSDIFSTATACATTHDGPSDAPAYLSTSDADGGRWSRSAPNAQFIISKSSFKTRQRRRWSSTSGEHALSEIKIVSETN